MRVSTADSQALSPTAISEIIDKEVDLQATPLTALEEETIRSSNCWKVYLKPSNPFIRAQTRGAQEGSEKEVLNILESRSYHEFVQ